MPARIPKDVCIAELKRVAEVLGRKAFTLADFDAQARISSQAVRMRCGGWDRALEAAGLSAPPRIGGKPVPFASLARAFVEAVITLGRIPSRAEVARQADYHPQTFSKAWSGYDGFKRKALAHLLDGESPLPVAPEVRALLEAERRALRRRAAGNRLTADQRRPLNFRGFVYAPSTEQGVVQLFGAIAPDLGFEILHTRSAFPDCLARRNKVTWRIEFEFTSADFRHHRHAVEGCDLIVCWRHDWPACPLRVLALEEVVRRLPATPKPNARRTFRFERRGR